MHSLSHTNTNALCHGHTAASDHTPTERLNSNQYQAQPLINQQTSILTRSRHELKVPQGPPRLHRRRPGVQAHGGLSLSHEGYLDRRQLTC
jgi:hypothetical protein